MTVLTFHAAVHPDADVARVGFPIDHPYVERCWTSSLGATSVALLRFVASTWTDGLALTVDTDDLRVLLGLKSDRLRSAVFRLDRFGFAALGGDQVDVYMTCRPVGHGRLQSLPEIVREQHKRLMADHMVRLGAAA